MPRSRVCLVAVGFWCRPRHFIAHLAAKSSRASSVPTAGGSRKSDPSARWSTSAPTVQKRPLAALLRPLPSPSGMAGDADESRRPTTRACPPPTASASPPWRSNSPRMTLSWSRKSSPVCARRATSKPTISSTWKGSPPAGSGLLRRIVRGANDAKSWGWQHPFGLGHFQGDLLQQIRPFFAEYVGPCGQRRLDVGLRSHAVEVDSEFSEILDFGGCEPE